MSLPFKPKDRKSTERLFEEAFRRLDNVEGTRGANTISPSISRLESKLTSQSTIASTDLSTCASRAASLSTNLSSTESKVVSAHP